MREQAEAKIQEWTKAVETLQQRRQALAAQLADIDTTIQRHLGAIAGARELLELDAPTQEQAQA
ncbi:MAG: hypothetical protein E6Q97_13145 [Desulfurellales bacterium]|nr:MAG: hypothetical protein E6Q97_13145 [Desulfurellales bacterium]